MKSILVLTALFLSAACRAAPPEFFVFDNGVGRGQWTPEQQASTLKELGYDGISYNYTNPEDLQVWIRTFKAHGLKIYGLYAYTYPDRADPYMPRFKEAIKLLKGTDIIIWLTLATVKDKTRNYDAETVKILRDIADEASAAGVRVALYGHAGFYCATASDSVRFVKLADRPNLGATINLCHEFIAGKGDKLDDAVKLAAPLSTLASINGIDVAHKQYLLRLDQSDFDVAAYLRQLRSAGYNGPIGLQCYSVKGDVRENLKISMETWKKIRPE